MFYVPAATAVAPVLVQETRTVAIPTTTYVALQPTPIFSAVPVLTTPLFYPTLGLLTKPVVKDTTEKISMPQEVTPPVKHVIHHYIPSCTTSTCRDDCELCCPWSPPNRSVERERRSRSPSPVPEYQQRHSRRDDYDRSAYAKLYQSIDEKIERVRRELSLASVSKRDKATETIDYFIPKSRPDFEHTRPKTSLETRVPYKQHYDAPKPRSRSRSASSYRGLSLPREPWHPTNRNDYPWRDAHLPAYREATLSRSSENLASKETAHERSHSNTRNKTSYCSSADYVYRPKSETESRKYYIQTTGKNPDCEVYSSLNRQSNSAYNHSFYSDIPKCDVPKQVNYTSTNQVDCANQSCIHIMPKHSSALEPPYLKIYNAPVTYLH